MGTDPVWALRDEFVAADKPFSLYGFGCPADGPTDIRILVWDAGRVNVTIDTPVEAHA